MSNTIMKNIQNDAWVNIIGLFSEYFKRSAIFNWYRINSDKDRKRLNIFEALRKIFSNPKELIFVGKTM